MPAFPAPNPSREETMKTLIALVPFVLAAGLASAQDPAAPKPDAKGTERQFAGEVVTADSAAKTLTVKTQIADANGARQEKTLVLGVSDEAASALPSLKTGDKVTVLWRRDDATQKDTVIKVVKTEPVQAPPSQ
jgi:Cu/Ag efflux protein CusF